MVVESSAARPVPVWVRLLAVPAVAVLFLVGLWVFGGVVSNDFVLATALTAGWFVVAAAAALYVSLRRPELRLPVGGTFLVTAAVVGGLLAWTTFRDKTVDERVVTGRAASEIEADRPTAGKTSPPAENVTLATGKFASLAHPTSGSAAVVELASGERKLALTSFETDPGPDLFLYLVAGGDPEEVGDNKNLGSLKGNRGNQQYTIPAGVDLEKYDTVVIWCRAFSVSFGAARLMPA